MMANEPSQIAPDVDRPRYWDKRVSAAYLRILGQTQEECAKSVGRSRRTIANWEAHETWPIARAEARERWLSDLEDASRRALLRTIKAGNADFGLKVLERLDGALAPPKLKHEHSGPDGKPIETESTVDLSRLTTEELEALKAMKERVRGDD